MKEGLEANYRPVSVLPCFSKIFDCLMYNRLYKYLKENNIPYEIVYQQ